MKKHNIGLAAALAAACTAVAAAQTPATGGATPQSVTVTGCVQSGRLGTTASAGDAPSFVLASPTLGTMATPASPGTMNPSTTAGAPPTPSITGTPGANAPISAPTTTSHGHTVANRHDHVVTVEPYRPADDSPFFAGTRSHDTHYCAVGDGDTGDRADVHAVNSWHSG